jgi:ABC-2 type transport system ATP-binding protein
MQAVLAEVAETGMTVLLSSHVIADLDGVCDHLLLLSDGRVQLQGDVEDLLTQHRVLVGSRELVLPDGVVEARTTGRQATVLARTSNVPGWDNNEPSLEELALAYLRSAKKVTA